jgi:hypothetical protein
MARKIPSKNAEHGESLLGFYGNFIAHDSGLPVVQVSAVDERCERAFSWPAD